MKKTNEIKRRKNIRRNRNILYTLLLILVYIVIVKEPILVWARGQELSDIEIGIAVMLHFVVVLSVITLLAGVVAQLEYPTFKKLFRIA